MPPSSIARVMDDLVEAFEALFSVDCFVNLSRLSDGEGYAMAQRLFALSLGTAIASCGLGFLRSLLPKKKLPRY